jgi:hypothetical protein
MNERPYGSWLQEKEESAVFDSNFDDQNEFKVVGKRDQNGLQPLRN